MGIPRKASLVVPEAGQQVNTLQKRSQGQDSTTSSCPAGQGRVGCCPLTLTPAQAAWSTGKSSGLGARSPGS